VMPWLTIWFRIAPHCLSAMYLQDPWPPKGALQAVPYLLLLFPKLNLVLTSGSSPLLGLFFRIPWIDTFSFVFDPKLIGEEDEGDDDDDDDDEDEDDDDPRDPPKFICAVKD